MLPYNSVIRKRLRLKGHPELPPYADTAAREPEPEPEPESESTQAPVGASDPRASAPLTEAQLRHARAMLAREEARVRQQAEKSYKQNMQEFNSKLAQQPDHYDMFKTSFTK